MGWLSRAFGGDARAPKDAGSALESALLAVLDRDLDRAEAMLAAAVRLASDDDVAYLALARLYRMRGEIGRAIRIHQNLLLRLDAGSPLGRIAMADLGADFAQGGFLRRAIASYEQVLAQDPRHLDSLRALVRLLAEVREFPRAIELARRLARLEGKDPAPAEADAARGDGRRRARRGAQRGGAQVRQEGAASGREVGARVDRARRAGGRARPRQGGAGRLAARSRARSPRRSRWSIHSSRRPTPRSGEPASSRPVCAACWRRAPTTAARVSRSRAAWRRAATASPPSPSWPACWSGIPTTWRRELPWDASCSPSRATPRSRRPTAS